MLASPGAAEEHELSLTDAVRQALDSNLDLISQRQRLLAAREEIGLARSVLLPQVNVGVQAQVLDSDRPDASRGNNRAESAQFQAGLSQLLYDEESWAGFEIQKHIYTGQVQQLASFQLSVVQDAADAFLEFDRAHRLLDIQQRNRELTRKNRETSRSRIAAGWSSDREVLRWDVQLANNDGSVRSAQVLLLASRFELNRVRNLPPEAAAVAQPATLEVYGFAYSRANIAQAIADPALDRKMRDFLARMGMRRSPDLAALDASIAAADRQLVASKRAFWVPTLSFGVGVDHLLNDKGGRQFNATEWGLKGVLAFPLFEGGAKFASFEQSRETLASLRTQRSATAQSLDQSIRAALAQASGAFETIDFARQAADAARKNFELVDASYVLGVSTILDLLDAQSQLLDAEIALLNSTYGFLEDLIAAERTLSFNAFLEPPTEVDALLDQLARELGLQP
jgi:outer membrane protein TolC